MSDLSNTFHDIEHAIGRTLSDWETKFIGAVRSEFSQVEPDLLALGESFASEVIVAAGVVASGGGTLSQALESILPQIPSELSHLGHIAMTLLGLAVQKMANDAATPATPSAP